MAKKKVISAKFLNEFNKLIEKYNPDRELNELAQKSSEIFSAMKDESQLNALASLLNVSSMGKLSPKRQSEIIEFNCEAYALIHDKELEEVNDIDYKEVSEAVKTFRTEYKQ